MAQKKESRGSKCININPCLHSCSQVFKSIGKGIGQFNICCGTCFLHMVTGNTDGIKFGHVSGGVFKDICNDLHGH